MDISKLEFLSGPVKKSDCLHLPKIPELNSEWNGLIIDKNSRDYLKRLPIVFYIGDTKLNNNKQIEYVKLKRNKSKTAAISDEWYSVNLFKIVKVPKMNDVINWFYNGIYPSVKDYLDNFDMFPSEMETLSRYVIELFQYKPKALQYLNKEINFLYNTDKAQDIFVLCKHLINNLRIERYELFNKFITRSQKQNFINLFLELNDDASTEDAKAYYNLNNAAIFDISYISSDDRVKRYMNPKTFIIDKKSAEFAAQVDEIKKLNKRIKEQQMKNDKRFLFEINQEIIDSLELTIFDTTILEETDQILYIFIDKDNNKRFYIEDFYYEFYISEYSNIIDNDYIVPLGNEHLKYSTSKVQDLKSIIFAINENHKRFMKYGEL